MTERTSGYAEAVVSLAEAEGSLDTVENELLTIGRAVDEHADLRERLTDTQLPLAQRLAFVESEALTAAHPTTRAALAMLIAGGRAGDIGVVGREVARRAAAARDRELAEVEVAVPLDDRRRERLRSALEEATGKQLELKVVVHPDVVGGVRATIGDIVIDGSLARRLDEVRTRVTR